ncbi:major facilitator superfamily transporter protein [Rutstroemia sp. NJR-2017a WRK4]|nr:major facilitator superfamily transporter protein [Rutstroemia sp. NJR-2017a WRK4]
MEEVRIPKARLIILCVSLCIGLFLSLLDTSIVATALFTIGEDFHALTSVNWVALAYTLSYLGCSVLFARIADIVGRRNAYVAAFVIFFAFSLGCGFAQSLNQLIACRALQGIGGAGLYSLTMVILPEISPPQMTKWIGGLAGAVVAMSGVLGPVLGGVITHYTSWKWIFWINAPIGIVPMMVFFLAWPNSNQLRPIERRPLRQLDVVSSFLLILASVLVVFSFQQAGMKANSWGKAIFLAPLLIGCLCWVLLFCWEYTVSRRWAETLATMLPFRLLQRRVYIFGAMVTLLMGFPYFMVIYNLPLRFQVVNGRSALSAGLGLLPMLGATAVASFIGGFINAKRNNTWQTLFAGSCFMLLGVALLTTLSNTTDVQHKTYGFIVLVGFGFGLTVSTVSMLSLIESSTRDHAVAQGITSQARIFGGSIGIAASTAVLGATQRRELTGIVSPEQLASLQSAAASFTSAQLEAVRQAYSDAFHGDMKVCAIVTGACVLVALGTYQRNPPTLEERAIEQKAEEEERKSNVGVVVEKASPHQV